jgi:hypothetical protein
VAATCKSCDAPLVWTVSRTSGRRIPLDAAPEKRIVIGPEGAEVMDTYVSHFATCPHADRHRRTGGDST